MVKQRQMTQTNNKNGRKNRKKQRNGYVGMLGLPSRYPSAPGDQARMNFNTAAILTIPSGDFIRGELFVLGQGTTTPTLTFLSGLSQLFNANAQCYTRFMVESLEVEVRATGVGGTANTFIAASYIPSHTSLDAPPTTLNELAQSNHYAESSLGTVGGFRVRPCEYFNDWRSVSGSVDSEKQAGLIQIYGSGPATSGAISAGVVTVRGVVHFCGLRV